MQKGRVVIRERSSGKSRKKISKKLKGSIRQIDNKVTLKEQYAVIRQDIVKLKDDIQKGYDIARLIVERNGIWGQFIRSR